MKLLLLIKALVYGSAIVNGFILDKDPLKETETSILPTITNGKATKTPEECTFNVFANCTKRLSSFFNGTNYNYEALYDFYCRSNGTADYIQCIKDRINPNCGPDTDMALFKESLSHIPPDYYDDYCRHFQESKDLLECQVMLSKLKGYQDCFTGAALKETTDPTNPNYMCKSIEGPFGCSYKYTRILCPSAINTFVNSVKSPYNCTIDFKNTVEASSCDDEMLEACRVAFNVPSYDNVAATVDFQCSGKSQEYSSCLQEVFAMCRDKNGFISTQMNASLELLENQTPLICSKDNTDLMKCTAMFPKISGFQDCITGVTLNKTVDPIDVCRYFETTMGCSTKYTDLMCPQNLNTLQNTTRVPQSCTQNMGGIQEETSCDFNMLEACQVAYGLPSSSGSDAGESLYDFICSGRLQRFLTCAQKVNAMCSSQGVDVSAILNSVLFYQRQSALTCSDKTGFIDYTNCTQRYLRSDDFVNCLSTANSFDTCGTTIAAYKCNLIAIQKECPATEVYYKKFIYNSLKDCNATYTIDIPLSVVSSSSVLHLSMWELVSVSSLYIVTVLLL